MCSNFSGNSQISLVTGSLKLNSLHMTLLNFTKEFKRHCILSRGSIVAYLPISFEKSGLSGEKKTLRGKKNRFRIRSLEALHIFIEDAFVGFKSHAVQKFYRKTTDSNFGLFHNCIIHCGHSLIRKIFLELNGEPKLRYLSNFAKLQKESFIRIPQFRREPYQGLFLYGKYV